MTSHAEGTDTATVAASLPAAPVEVQAEPRQAPFVMVRLVDQEELCRRARETKAGTLLIVWIRLNAAAMRNPEDTHFTVPYTDFTRSTGCDDHTITKALRELERLGFVAASRRTRSATKYRLLRGTYAKGQTTGATPVATGATPVAAGATPVESSPPMPGQSTGATPVAAGAVLPEPLRQSSRIKTSRLKTPLEVPPSPDSATPETSGPEDRLRRILAALSRFTPPELPPDLVAAARSFATCQEVMDPWYFADRLEVLGNPGSVEDIEEATEALLSWATPVPAPSAGADAAPTVPVAAPPSEPPPPPPPDRRRTKKEPFRPPSLEEVTEYCGQRQNGLDPQVFLDFYQSKGWLVGNSPMRDWRAAVRTWEKRDQRERRGPDGRRSGLAIGQVVHVDDGRDDWGF